MRKLYLVFTVFGCFSFIAVRADVPLRGFSDVGYDYTSTMSGDSSNNFFHGEIDLFFTRPLSDRINFLVEVVFELDSTNNGVLDPERLWIQYEVDQWLKIKAGRAHTALGYWNNLYQHGSYLQTSINRPFMYNFEDENGILPIHSSGLEFRGEGDLGSGMLGYIANIANGRGATIDPPQIVSDSNDMKALSLMIYYQFDNGFRFGGTIYKDTFSGSVSGSELIFGGHLVFINSNLEILTEYLRVQHNYTSGHANANLNGFYSQLAYHINDYWTPYVRFDLLNTSVADSYTGISADRKIGTFGIKYELSLETALKAEYRYTQYELASNENSVAVNWSFGW